MNDGVSRKVSYTVAFAVIVISIIALVGGHALFTDDDDFQGSQLAVMSDDESLGAASESEGGSLDTSLAKIVGVAVILVSVFLFLHNAQRARH